MTSKKKAVLYPYDAENFPFIKHSDLLVDYKIVAAISPIGWGMGECDAGSVYGVSTGVTIKNDFSKTLEICDAVFFADSYNGLRYDEHIQSKIFEAIDSEKDIVCTLNLNEDHREEIRSRANKKGIRCIYKLNNFELENYGIFEEYVLHEPKVPVIFVIGNGERTNKYDIQLSLRKMFLQNGYNISQVGSKNYCELFGFHSFPKFMYSDSIDNSTKILLLNQFINYIDKNEHPDVILIGIPGGIMPFNNKFHNYFGLFNYMMAQAISPDFVIFSTLYEDYVPEYYEQIKKLVKYKFGYDINCFNLSNTKIDWDATQYSNKIQYITLDNDFIGKKLEQYSSSIENPIFNSLNNNGIINMFDFMVTTLQQNSQAVSL